MISPLQEFRDIYSESGIKMLYRDYIQRSALILAAVLILSAMGSYALHIYVLQVTGTQMLAAVSVMTMTVTLLAGVLILFYPMQRKSENTKKIENGLLYSLGYMTVLSASGLGIETIMERVAEVEDNESIRQLATKFVLNMKLFGMDITSSLMDVAHRSSSEVLKYVIESITNNIQTSGELKNLFKFEVERQMRVKRENLKKILSTMTYMGELYVALLVVGPILFILIITILSILGGGASSGSVLQLNLITFIGVPILATGFIILLDTSIGGEE